MGAFEEGQPVKALAYARVKGGYVVVLLTVEDWQVIDAEVLSSNDTGGFAVPETHAQDTFRVEAARRLLWPNSADLQVN